MFRVIRIKLVVCLIFGLPLAVLISSCGENPTEQSDLFSNSGFSAGSVERSRDFAMAFGAIPGELSEQSYLSMFDLAAGHGDAIMIQRAVPWLEMTSGIESSSETMMTIIKERELLREFDLQLAFAIDPWEPSDRSRLVGEPPGDGFDDPAVTEAYLTYVEFIVEELQPRWLALAVDLDQVALARPDDLNAYEVAYRTAYERVKTLAPETKVFATFQFESLQGLLGWGVDHLPQWSLILRFRPILDLLAVSSFPSFIYPFAGDVPNDYYARLLAFGKPLALMPVGYSSEPSRGGVTFGTLTGQQEFLERILTEASEENWELVVWLFQQDPSFVDLPPYDLVEHMGLLDRQTLGKPAWTTWRNTARRSWSVTLPVESILAETKSHSFD